MDVEKKKKGNWEVKQSKKIIKNNGSGKNE